MAEYHYKTFKWIDTEKFTSYKFIFDLLQFPKYIIIGPIS